MGKIIYWFWNCAWTDQSLGRAHLKNQALTLYFTWIKYCIVSTETQARKSKEKKKQTTNIRFVFLLRILFRYSKINTFPLTVHSVLELFCQDLYKKQRWDLRRADLTVRWRYNTPARLAPASQSDCISQHRGGIVRGDGTALHHPRTPVLGGLPVLQR